MYNHVSALHLLPTHLDSIMRKSSREKKSVSGRERVRVVGRGRWLAKASSFISQCVAHKNISLIVCELYCRNRRFVSQAIMSNKHNALDLLL